MLLNVQEERIAIGDSWMDYVVMGSGETPLVILHGLGDGLKTVRGQSLQLAWYYRKFTKRFKIYVFSRKDKLKEDYTTEDMAKDQKVVLDKIGIKQFYLMGVSQGGMICQHIAIRYPEAVKKMVLVATISKPNKLLLNTIYRWSDMVKNEDYKSLIVDTCERLYSAKRLRIYRPMYSIISKIGKPESFDRFLIQAKSCITHNAYNLLERIECPTLIIASEEDKVVGKLSSEEMARQIPNNKLVIYAGVGHALYEEVKVFKQDVLKFLNNPS